MQRIQLSHPSGATAEVTPHGAQVLSWKSAVGRELIYLSPLAEDHPGAAIRGGIPVIFPQFGGPPPLRHGFARNLIWELASQLPDSVTFELSDSSETRQRWPHAFKLSLQIQLLSDSLRLEFCVKNRGVLPFEFTAALHTYLRVDAIENAALRGLQGRRYQDDATGYEAMDHDPAMRFHGMVDRVYYDAASLAVQLLAGASTMGLTGVGFPDLVVWNPGEEAAANLRDLPEGGYREFVCVEAAVARPFSLESEESWSGIQLIQLMQNS